MKHRLTPQQEQVLEAAVRSHRLDLLPILTKLGQAPLSDEEKEALRGAVFDEIAQSGLDSEDEPNTRGYLLEELIDALGHI